MDFGPISEEKPRIKSKKTKTNFFAIALLAVLAAGGLAVYYTQRNVNPLPDSIKSQVSFKVVYPSSKSGKLSSSGYQYQAGQKALTFSLDKGGTNIVFSEQTAPNTVGNGSQVYYQALGLHPYAQFASKLGPVALAKFYNPGTLSYLGQTGVMAASGTLVTAHPDKDLTNSQWKDLFDSLKITK
jgi:hypothetical protein